MLFVTVDVPGHKQFYCDVATRAEAEILIANRIALSFGPGVAILADGNNIPLPTTKFVYYIRRGTPDELICGDYKEVNQWF